MPAPNEPKTGEVWDAQPSPTMGAEQSGVRPVLVISNDWFNRAENYLYLVVPVIGTDRNLIFHHKLHGKEGGLTKHSVIMCDQVRAVSPLRFLQRRGQVSEATLANVRRLVSMFIEDEPPYTGPA